jgi:uncharacterized metal-binding protein YceD (DUF177 family)
MKKSKISLTSLNKMIRIHEQRLSKNTKLLSKAHQNYLEALEKIKQRKRLIKNIKYEEIKIKAYTNDLNRKLTYYNNSMCRVDDVRYWLNYDLEMHKYYLMQEKEELESKELEYINNKKSWFRLKKKLDFMKEINFRLIKNSFNEFEKQEEMEMQDKLFINQR